jgi:predicted dehydrogenase
MRSRRTSIGGSWATVTDIATDSVSDTAPSDTSGAAAALRVLIVGYGYMGEIRHRVANSLPDLALVGVCDPRRRPRLPAGCQYYEDYVKALDDLRPDIVFVCTPNYLIPEVAVEALRRGHHVFCEKPPGRCLADVQAIRDAELSHPEARLVFGFNHRHHPGITDAKAMVDSGTLGRVLVLRGVYGKSGSEDFERSWRNDPSLSGGGILLDQGIHMLDLFRLFCGDFNEVLGMRQTSHWDIPVEDNAFVLLRNARGQMAQLHSSATSWKHTFRLEMILEQGYLVVTGLLSKSGSYGRETLLVGRRPRGGETAALGNPREEITYYDTDPSWDLEVQHLVDCIRTGAPVSMGTSLDALRVMEIVDRVYRQDPLDPPAGRTTRP